MRTITIARPKRRGAAMLLVIISLMMATILTTAYLSSRDNSTLIGVNASHGAAARSAAITGLDMAAAMMQTRTNWRTANAGGMLLDNVPVGGGIASVQALDEMTMQVPTATSEYFILLASGVVDGVEEVARGRVYAPLAAENTVDVDLSDFAVFVSSRMDLANHATITRWPKSPLYVIPSRVAIGTRATSSASIVMTDTSGAIDGSVYMPPGSSSSLVVKASGPATKPVQLLDVIPMPAAPNVGVAATVAIPVPADSVVNGGTSMVMANSRYRKLEVTNNGVRTFQGNLRIVAEQDLKITGGGKIVINGNVKLAVFGNMEMDGGAIELASSATLSLYVRGSGSGNSLRIRDSYIGDTRIDNVRDNTGNAKYFNPAQVMVYSMPPASSPGEWLIEKNSVIKGSIYCPDASKVTFADQSALYGRIAAKSLTMTVDAAIFYDPRLDNRTGYANEKSALYNTDGTILAAYKSLASLDVSTLQAAADLSGKIVKSIFYGSGDVTPTAGVTPDDDTDDGTGITPRPVHITYELLWLSNNVHEWETGTNSAGRTLVSTTADLQVPVVLAAD